MEGFFFGAFLALVLSDVMPHPSLNTDEWEWAVEQCSANSGVAAVRPSGRWVMATKARCNNGAVFRRGTRR